MKISGRKRRLPYERIFAGSKEISWKFLQALPDSERQRYHESVLQMAIVQYLQENYPKVIFKCDTSAVKVSVGQAVKMKKLGNTRAWPDLHIAEPRRNYYGCFLELKKDGERIARENGNWVSPHVAEQAEMLENLTKRGYYAEFATGFSEAKKAIDWYLGK